LRGRTVDELIYAFRYAWIDKTVGAIVLTGAGEKAFCSGGDQKERATTGGYGETEMGMFEIERLHRLIRLHRPHRGELAGQIAVDRVSTGTSRLRSDAVLGLRLADSRGQLAGRSQNVCHRHVQSICNPMQNAIAKAPSSGLEVP
jgi:hypothetical protein